MSKKQWIWFAAGIATIFVSPANAQSCLGRPDFDVCMDDANVSAQNQISAAQQQSWLNYLQKNGPWLKQQYDQYRGPMDFQQFAYWNMITANGTNIAAAMQAQQDQFRGNQGAYASVQQGNDAYRKGMYANGETASEAVEGYSIGAIRGDSTQIDPSTGQEKLLPYAQPYNQPFDIGGERYVQNERGFYQWNGTSWILMQPGR